MNPIQWRKKSAEKNRFRLKNNCQGYALMKVPSTTMISVLVVTQVAIHHLPTPIPKHPATIKLLHHKSENRSPILPKSKPPGNSMRFFDSAALRSEWHRFFPRSQVALGNAHLPLRKGLTLL